jgi:pimeloyl-ACP methyl ester carboxylesterase
MRTYLLLHGAMRGAWLWDRIKPIMERAGATVIAYDLPGHGMRVSERAGVTMSSYIDDVLHYIRSKDLKDLILVGHSMSGIVVSKIAEEESDRILHLVYLAAVVPADGQALIDLLTPERQESLRKLEGKVEELYGPIEALRPNYFTDQTGPDQDFFLKQLTPQPLAVFFEKIPLKRFYNLTLPKTYIMGLRDKALPPDLTRSFAARLGVTPIEIDAGHDMMVVRPEETAMALLRTGEQRE